MRRSTIEIILVIALGCLVAPRATEAQQPVKVHRVLLVSLISGALLTSGLLESYFAYQEHKTALVRL